MPDGKLLMVHSGASGAFARALKLFGLDREIRVDVGPVEMASELTEQEYAVLHTRLPEIFKSRPRDEWLRALWDNELAALPVERLGGVFDDDQVRHNRLVQTIVDPDLGPIEVVAPPVLYGMAPVRLQRAAPRLNEDGAAVRAAGWRSERGPSPRRPRPLGHPLDGVRVLDLGAYFAGPFASRLLSDLGADVVKVEQVHGDAMRPLLDMFEAASRGKRSLAIDLKATPPEVVHQLVVGADVLHHNLRPGVAERLGVGYDQVSAINPAIVYCHAPGYGSSGPKATLQSFAPLQSGWVGMWYEAAGEGNPPIRSFGNEDHYNGLLGACSMLLGLVDRERSGLGVHIEAPQLHSSVFAVSHVVRRNGTVMTTVPGLDRGQFGRSPFDRIYPCASGWLAVYCETPDHAARLLDGVGLCADEQMLSAYDCHRPASETDELAAALGGRLAAQSAEHWWHHLDGRGVPCEIVREASWEPLVFDNAALQAAGAVTSVDHPLWGQIGSLALLFHLSGTPGVVRGRAPLVGEHSAEVLGEIGVASATIEDWRRRGIIREVHVEDLRPLVQGPVVQAATAPPPDPAAGI